MGLRHKSVEAITFDDIDAFCKLSLPESLLLDYKVEMPRDLAKLIAALANTRGGHIIIGVDAESVTNQPIWPPVKGMPTRPGIDEQITAIARDAIYPPVRIDVSPVIENQLLAGHSIVVVKVDPSPDAPHATDEGRRVYVKTGSTTKPLDFAKLDWLEYLFDRRKKDEVRRERMRAEDLQRATHMLVGALPPTAWGSVIPIYPSHDLCKLSVCYDFLASIDDTVIPARNRREVQRIPGGAISLRHARFSEQAFTRSDCTIVRSQGHVQIMRTILQIDRRLEIASLVPLEQGEKIFEFMPFWQRVEAMFLEARKFFQRNDVEQPGLLSVGFGMRNVHGWKMLKNSHTGKPFLDVDYYDEITVPASTFIQPDKGLELLMNHLAYAFDLETPEGL